MCVNGIMSFVLELYIPYTIGFLGIQSWFNFPAFECLRYVHVLAVSVKFNYLHSQHMMKAPHFLCEMLKNWEKRLSQSRVGDFLSESYLIPGYH